MTVYELNKNQLKELKHSLFYNFRYDKEKRKEYKQYLSKEDQKYLDDINTCFWDIPNNLLFKVYDGIYFVNDDFCSGQDEYEPNANYDSLEDINKCLNCQKSDCDNCLKSINGV